MAACVECKHARSPLFLRRRRRRRRTTQRISSLSVVSASQMLQAGIEALFGRNRDHHRKRHYFRRVRRHQPPRHHTSEDEELAKLFLDEPQTKKELLHGPTFAFGAMQGWRATMEDKHKHLIPFDSSSWKLWSYFALFDGHNGKIDLFSKGVSKRSLLFLQGLDAAKNSADHLHVRLLESLNEMLTNDESNRTKPGHAVRSSTLDIEHLKTAIKKTYFQLDQDLREMVKDDSGCVCVRQDDNTHRSSQWCLSRLDHLSSRSRTNLSD